MPIARRPPDVDPEIAPLLVASTMNAEIRSDSLPAEEVELSEGSAKAEALGHPESEFS